MVKPSNRSNNSTKIQPVKGKNSRLIHESKTRSGSVSKQRLPAVTAPKQKRKYTPKEDKHNVSTPKSIAKTGRTPKKAIDKTSDISEGIGDTNRANKTDANQTALVTAETLNDKNSKDKSQIKNHIAIAVTTAEEDDVELDYEDDVVQMDPPSQLDEFSDENPESESQAGASSYLPAEPVQQAMTNITEEQLMAIPNLQSLLDSIVNKKVEEKLATAKSGGISGKNGTPMQMRPSGTNMNGSHRKVDRKGNVVKSPSDTTLYMPALNRLTKEKLVENFMPLQQNTNNDEQVMEKISGFVENIRIQTTGTDSMRNSAKRRLEDEFDEVEMPKSRRQEETTQSPQQSLNLEDPRERDRLLREAKEQANKTILEAEKYKATIEQPKGRIELNDHNDPNNSMSSQFLCSWPGS